jgi:hypothetical protein
MMVESTRTRYGVWRTNQSLLMTATCKDRMRLGFRARVSSEDSLPCNFSVDGGIARPEPL